MNGQIWDSIHAKPMSWPFRSAPACLNEMVGNMQVGQKVQAIIPSAIAFRDKGLCLDDRESLIKRDASLPVL